ncbi:hypothetical protein DXG03_001458 [Asterophora parasitica]|uniref:F-box domain-containing protein n=1 Tax=Asterophora parasitica TaxID=117018 RepID=A0A9P7GE91_9AGAR|nr:hypothetical protein DXG03_001458 [Asterophora parasitica]
MSHVCTYWRDVALGTPLLWNSIDVYSIRSIECVSRYLDRSRNCLLDVRFDIWGSDRFLNGEISGAKILPVVDIVVQHIHRWKTLLVLASNSTTTASILSTLAHLEAPSLERIRIVDDGGDIDDEPPSPSGVFQPRPGVFIGGAPRLAAVWVNNLRVLPPLTNVTTLHLHTPSYFSSAELNPSSLKSLTATCPSLSSLSIRGNFRGDWPHGGPVTIPSLRSLWFESGDTLASSFLATVSMPNLVSLWLDCPQYRVIQRIFNSTSRPNFPALKYLTLQGFDFYASTHYAKAFPTITALHLPFCNLFHITFLKETLIENDHSRWPNLDTIVFRSLRDTHAKKFSTVIDDMVRERHNSIHPIRRLLVDKDVLANLYSADSIGARTDLKVLSADSFDDPWWIMSHMDSGDQI